MLWNASPRADGPGSTECHSLRIASTYSSAGMRLRTAIEKSQYEQRRTQKGTWRYRCCIGEKGKTCKAVLFEPLASAGGDWDAVQTASQRMNALGRHGSKKECWRSNRGTIGTFVQRTWWR